MTIPTAELRINGNVAWPLPSTDVVAPRLTLYNLDGPDELTFSERGIALPGSYNAGSLVAFYVNGTLRFSGEIVDPAIAWDDRIGWCRRYRAQGLKFRALRVPVTHPSSGRGLVAFNLSPLDLDYDSSLAGKTVGQIISAVLTYDQHATDLYNAGVTAFTEAPPYVAGSGTGAVLKAATIADLASLNVVPQDPVLFSGSQLWAQIEALLQDWQGAFAPLILADGTIRFLDTRALTPKTLTLDSDPVEHPELSRETSDIFTRVVVRGDDRVDGRWAILSESTLAEAFTNSTYSTNAAAKAAWRWEDFVAPKGGVDEGTVLNVGSTTLTLKSSDTTKAWAANKWSNEEAFIVAENPLAGGAINYSEQRRVVSNTALNAGGTSIVTVDYPFTQGGFTRYKLVGQGGPGSMTYRKYKILDAYVASHLVNRFAVPVPFGTQSGGGATTVTPVGVSTFRPVGSTVDNEFPVIFRIKRDSTGTYIILSEPSVKPWNTMANLITGGGSVTQIKDLRLFLPVSLGVLKAIKPTSGYEGKAYTEDGIQKTWYIDLPNWRYPGDQTSIESYAQMMLDTVKDPVVEGPVSLNAFYEDAVTTPGIALSIAGQIGSTPYTTGPWSTLNAPVRKVIVDFPEGGAVVAPTTLYVNSRRRPWTGASGFVHPGFADGGGFGAFGGASLAFSDYAPIGLSMPPAPGAFGAFNAAGLMGQANSASGNAMGQAQGAMNAGLNDANTAMGGALNQANSASADAMDRTRDPGRMTNVSGPAANWLGEASSGVGNALGGASRGTSNWTGGAAANVGGIVNAASTDPTALGGIHRAARKSPAPVAPEQAGPPKSLADVPAKPSRQPRSLRRGPRED